MTSNERIRLGLLCAAVLTPAYACSSPEAAPPKDVVAACNASKNDFDTEFPLPSALEADGVPTGGGQCAAVEPSNVCGAALLCSFYEGVAAYGTALDQYVEANRSGGQTKAASGCGALLDRAIAREVCVSSGSGACGSAGATACDDDSYLHVGMLAVRGQNVSIATYRPCCKNFKCVHADATADDRLLPLDAPKVVDEADPSVGCVACVQPGYACRTTDDCCIGVCNQGQCRGKAKGEACAHSRECALTICRDGVCPFEVSVTPPSTSSSGDSSSSGSSSSGGSSSGGCTGCHANTDCGSCERCELSTCTCRARAVCP
jgi:hypothetical protein